MGKNTKNTLGGNRATRRLSIIAVVLSVLSLILILNIFFGVTLERLIQPFAIADTNAPENVMVVQIDKGVSDIWNSRYKSDLNEFLYCLYGDALSNGYHITSIKETTIVSSDSESLTFESCNKFGGYLGTLHSHPQPDNPRFIASCTLSDRDLFTFGKYRAPLSGVICNPGEYGFFSTQDLVTQLEVVII